jgi:hypothetical protein
MLSKLLALFSKPAISLQAANETVAQAQTALTRVGEMFAAAGLNLEAMLEAGTDSLKAHLASLDQSAEIAALGEKVKATAEQLAGAQALLATAKIEAETAEAALKAHAELLKVVGFDAQSAQPEDFKAIFTAHVEKHAALVLARDGRPPVAQVAPDAKPAVGAVLSDAEHLAKWEAMAPGSREAADYGSKHYDAINRALRAAGRA